MPALQLTAEQIDDLLYCARAGETEDMTAYFNELVEGISGDKSSSAKTNILEQVLDSSENGMLHYTCANGHLETLKLLLPFTTLRTLLHQNNSGNTPLHWAGLNGHLFIVKLLVSTIESYETKYPTEASEIKSITSKRDQQARKNKLAKQEQNSSSSAAAETAEEDKKEEEKESHRSIWDIKNNFGRGPTSESQLNDQEAVVQFFLNAMANDSAAPPQQAADDKTEELTQKTENLNVEESPSS
ncbi:unnamed protein product [Sympodiomycopsis kandeliae]